MAVRVLHGDMREQLQALKADGVRVQSIVTDPPYHLTAQGRGGRSNLEQPSDKDLTTVNAGNFRRLAGGFMGKAWDGGDVAFQAATWRLCYDLLPPGGHLLAFAGTRTYHRMACAIEDAGFELRDTIAWLYGSGFPKSHNVSKGIDKAAPRVGMFEPFARHYEQCRTASGLTHSAICEAGKFYDNHNHGGASVNWSKGHNVPTLAQWAILQPLLGLSDEWLPLIARVEAEREIVGTASGSRLAVAPGQDNDRGDTLLDITAPATAAARQWDGWGTALKPAMELICVARKPLVGTVAANVLAHGTGALNIDGCRIGTEGDAPAPRNGGASKGILGDGLNGGWGEPVPGLGRWPANVVHSGEDEVVKAFPESGGQAGAVNGDEPSSKTNNVYGQFDGRPATFPRGDSGSAARFFYSAKADSDDRLGSKHPTVKPVDLMRWLVRLVTPPGGTCLDPFAGSGTTGMACMAEGFDCILVEREAEYVADIQARIAHVHGEDTPLFAGLKQGDHGKGP